MKARLLIALLALAGIFTACKKNKKEEIECCRVCCHIRDNFMSAVKADSTWAANDLVLSHTKDSLILTGSRMNESLRLSIKIIDTGKYVITPKSGVYNVTVGKDVVIGEYRATTDTANYIKVVNYDETLGSVSGEFNVKMIKSARYADPDLVSEVSFVKGRFWAALPK